MSLKRWLCLGACIVALSASSVPAVDAHLVFHPQAAPSNVLSSAGGFAGTIGTNRYEIVEIIWLHSADADQLRALESYLIKKWEIGPLRPHRSGRQLAIVAIGICSLALLSLLLWRSGQPQAGPS